MPRLFGEIGAALMVDDLLALALDVRPDVIVYESRRYAAAAVARAIGAVPVLRAVTSLLPPEVETLAGDAVTPLWRELGLDPPIFAGMFDGLVMSEWPASLDDPAGTPAWQSTGWRPRLSRRRRLTGWRPGSASRLADRLSTRLVGIGIFDCRSAGAAPRRSGLVGRMLRS